MFLIFTHFQQCTRLRPTSFRKICKHQNHLTICWKNSKVARLSLIQKYCTMLILSEMYWLFVYASIFFWEITIVKPLEQGRIYLTPFRMMQPHSIRLCKRVMFGRFLLYFLLVQLQQIVVAHFILKSPQKTTILTFR